MSVMSIRRKDIRRGRFLYIRNSEFIRGLAHVCGPGSYEIEEDAEINSALQYIINICSAEAVAKP